MFCYYWIPGVLWKGFSVFSFLAWIRPNSVVVNQLFGRVTGLSLIPITFDWTYVTAFLDPLLAPTSAHVNTLVGLLVFVVAMTICIVYSGAMYADYLPMVTLQTYDNTQNYYNVSRILGDGLAFDEQKYKEYSPVFLSPALALNYGLSLASLAAALVHTGLYHGKDLWHRLRAARNQEPDVHMRLMARYDDAPDWWYAAMLAVSASLGLAAGETHGSALPWWAFAVSMLVALVFMVPIMILAVSNIGLGLNIIGPFLAGFMIPGRPVGVMMFNVFTTVTVVQAQVYSGDLNMAHYMKIPPKTTFWCQVAVAVTAWAVLVQIAVMRWMLGHIDKMCDLEQASRFSCPNGRAFFASSVVWGVLGPRRMFGAGSMYAQLNWFWLVGAALPVVLYLLTRRLGVRLLAALDAPMMLGATAWLPPGTPLSYVSWAMVRLVFNRWIRGRWGGWWCTYNYTAAAALDVGLVLGTVAVFFAITLPDVEAPRWWGNVAVLETLDATGAAVLKTVADRGTFGSATW